MKKLLLALIVVGFVVVSASFAHADYATITLDGYTGDWAGIDEVGISSIDRVNDNYDLTKAYLANNGADLFLRLDVAGWISPNGNDSYQLWIDADNSAATGFRGGSGAWTMGADYRLYFNTGYSGLEAHTGAQNNDGWIWPGVPRASQHNIGTLEMATALSNMALGVGSTIKVVANVNTDGGWYTDYIGNPDNGGISYTIEGAPQQPPVPEPSSLLLLGSGIFGLAAFVRKK